MLNLFYSDNGTRNWSRSGQRMIINLLLIWDLCKMHSVNSSDRPDVYKNEIKIRMQKQEMLNFYFQLFQFSIQVRDLNKIQIEKPLR